MKKYNKLLLHFISGAYILLTIIELVKYLLTKSNVFGLIYLIICSLVIFLLIPTTINYKERKSMARISKLCLIILIGLFSSYFLSSIVISGLRYTDSSILYKDSILVIKSILKPILYFFILIVILIDIDAFNYISKKIKKLIEK